MTTSSTSRKDGLWPREALAPLLNPSSIAIVGASPRPGSFGNRTQRNLAGFGGRVLLVNPRYGEIDGTACYPGISALPETPDCAVVVVGQEGVEEIVADCVARGVGGVIVYAAGYAETGVPERAALQERLVGRVRGTATRLMGPNCMGATNYETGARMTFGRMPDRPPPGAVSIGIVTQSGALSMSLAQAIERGVSVSHVFTTGNSGDVALPDLVAYLAGEPGCHGIVAVFEGLRDARPLLEAARLARDAGKPLVIYKMAVGLKGAAAALSHTGSLAGSQALYAAALEDLGAVMVDDFDLVMETVQFLAKAGRPKGQGPISVVTSGGAGIIIADKAEKHGIPMPLPRGETLKILQENVPQFGTIGNPTDLTAQTMNDDTPVRNCAAAVMADPGYGAAVIPYSFADAMAQQRLEIWKGEAARQGKMICSLWVSQWFEGPGSREGEAHPNVAIFRSPDNLFRTLAKWYAREKAFAAPAPAPLALPGARDRAKTLLTGAGSAVLTEREAKAVLAEYGVPVVREALARSADEAVSVAASIGYPIVLKIESPDIPHKTEADGIRLNLADAEAVRAAFSEVTANARAHRPEARINGVLVQPFIAAGVEILIGGRVEPAFGPAIVVALGGALVELLQDSAIRLAPVTARQAAEMLESLKGARLLDGFRGSEPVDKARLAEIICRVSEFIADHAGEISELDVNPLICSAGRILAVDAVIVRAGKGAPHS
jgi:acetyl-CoA synthetase